MKTLGAKNVINVVDDLDDEKDLSQELGLLPSEEEEEYEVEQGTVVQARRGKEGRKGDSRSDEKSVAHNPEHPTPYVSPAATVDLCYDTKTQTLVPPEGWGSDSRYRLVWPEEVFEDPDEDKQDEIDELNLKRKSFQEWGWRVRAVRASVLHMKQECVNELIRIAWSPQWVPLKMVTIAPKAAASFAKAKATPMAARMTNAVRLQVLEFFQANATVGQTFYARGIYAYTIVTINNEDMEVVHVDFADSWEHAGALTHNYKLWSQVVHHRGNEVRNIVKRKNVRSDPKTLARWKELEGIVTCKNKQLFA